MGPDAMILVFWMVLNFNLMTNSRLVIKQSQGPSVSPQGQ